jgi:gliding motility-associated-like protein
VASLPALNFSLDTSCIKSISHFTNLTDTTTTGAIQWAWKFGNGDTALTTNGITTYNTAGKYHVILKATQLSCPAYKPTLLDSTLNISFPVPDSILPSVSTYKSTLTPVAGRSLPGYKYLWLPSTGIQDPDSISTNFNFSSTQQYTIQLISPAGCITSDSLLVRVYDDKTLDIFVPKSFTPNGDGVNDILYPYIAGIQQFHYFRVINRYGKLLFETKNENVGWNGSVNGVAQPMSVYFWIAEGVAADGSIVQKTGQVLLIR